MLVVWSGGLDSTYCLWMALRARASGGTFGGSDCSDVRCLVVEHRQFPGNAPMARARAAIEKWFDRRGVQFTSTVAKLEMENGGFIKTDLIQQPFWATFAPMFLRKDEDAMFGFVRGDDAAPWFSILQKAFDSTQKALNKNGHFKCPILTLSKAEMMAQMPESLVALTWSCDTTGLSQEDRDLMVPCGKCHPCLTRKVAEYERDLILSEMQRNPPSWAAEYGYDVTYRRPNDVFGDVVDDGRQKGETPVLVDVDFDARKVRADDEPNGEMEIKDDARS